MENIKSACVNGVAYLLGTAGSLILACPKCGEEHFRPSENYFWGLVPENKAWIERGQKNYWGDPSWHKCGTCRTQMEPIRVDELESRWKPFWLSLGWQVLNRDTNEYYDNSTNHRSPDA